MVENKKKSGTTQVVFLLFVILLLLLIGYYVLFEWSGQDTGEKAQEVQPDQAVSGRTMDVVLYFASSEKVSLVPEDRMIPLESLLPDIATAIVHELAQGPESSNLTPVLPAGIEVRTVFFDRGILYIDFGRSLVEKSNLGTSGEVLLVYSLVNSLSEFSSIQLVQILVGGKEVAGLRGDRGHLDLSQPFVRDTSLIGVF